MFKNNFTSGEMGPNLYGRSDMAQFANGCALARNFLPQVEGPLRRRPGFWFAGLNKDQATASRPVEYIRAVDDAYVVELCDGYTRFWGADGRPILSDGSPYQIASPYSAAQLPGLRWKQLGNVIVFFHKSGTLRPKRLQKVSETSWNWADYELQDGPWQGENSETAKTVGATDYRQGQTVTLTANFAMFTSDMVGRRLRLRNSRGLPGLRTWAPDLDPYGHALRISNGRVYVAVDYASTEPTGNTPPSHDIGDVSDGKLFWRYLHDNSGVVRITGYTSATSATGYIERTLPTVGQLLEGDPEDWQLPDLTSAVALEPTFCWAWAVYSDYDGWPTAWPELREERLIVAGGASSVDKCHGSQAAGYYADKASFTPGLGSGAVLDDDAFTCFVGDDSFKALWLASGPLLVCGTHGGESVIVGDTGEAILTPGGAKPRALSRFGSADVRPVKAQDAIVFVARGGKSLRDLTVSAYDYPGQGNDLSFMAKHIASRRFAELAWAGAPDYTLWARLADGGLASLIYNREQGVKGWCQHELGGGLTVEGLCVIPDAAGNDRLWVFANRMVDETPQRLILWMSLPDDRLRLDAAMRYFDAEAPVTGVDGLDHLNGDAVTAMIGPGSGQYAEGGRDLVVEDGEITLPMDQEAVEIVVGLPYLSRFESLPLTANSAQGERRKVQSCGVAYEGVNVRGGLLSLGEVDEALARDFGDTQVLTARHRVEELLLPGDDELDPRVFVECDDGFDMILKSLKLRFA